MECDHLKRVTLLFLLAVGFLPSPVVAQQPAEVAASGPHQVGLIDMAHIFKNYEKFKSLSNALQQEFEQLESEVKSQVENIRSLEQQIAGGTSTSTPATVGNLEEELLKARTKLETFKLASRRELIQKQKELYKTIYLDVDTTVEQYMLAVRLNRAGLSDETIDPQEITSGLNRLVTYLGPQDDLTDPILNYLNSNWRKQQDPQGAPVVVPAGNTRPASQNPAATRPATETTR